MPRAPPRHGSIDQNSGIRIIATGRHHIQKSRDSRTLSLEKIDNPPIGPDHREVNVSLRELNPAAQGEALPITSAVRAAHQFIADIESRDSIRHLPPSGV